MLRIFQGLLIIRLWSSCACHINPDALTCKNQLLISEMTFEAMLTKAKTADGFLAALDQSGGSTPKALKLYGIPDDVSLRLRHRSWFSHRC